MFGQGLVWDSSGNSMLSGNYYFREVIYDSSGGDAYTLYGTVSFTGTGSYTMSATEIDVVQGEGQTGTISGSYAIGAGGFGYLTNPLSSGVQIRGMVSNGVFIGSATEGGFNDLFVAGQIPSTVPTASTFNGTYSMVYLNYSSALDGAPYDGQFTLSPNGAGTASLSNINGFYVTSNSTTGAGATVAVSQGNSSGKYTVSNGAVVLNFPALSNGTSTELLSGQNYLYFSPDGNFVFGGSAGNNLQADFFVGVKTGGTTPQLNSSLYYNAGVFLPVSVDGYDIDSYYGSISLNSGTDILHSRLFSAGAGSSFDSVTTGTAPTTPGATYSDPYFNYTIGSGGNYRIGFGTTAAPGIDIALAAPTFSGSGVYLNPTGVVNAASYAPFTQGLSPGELLVLTGTDLAPNATIGAADIAQSTNFPTNLNGVQVLIDQTAAPLYYVSANQIAAIVPWEVTQYPVNFASVQVNNNGLLSHTITEFLSAGTPGVFTNPADGLGLAAAEHGDGTLITERSPAQPGESISVYLTGLGQVIPTVPDGTPGTSSAPFNQTFNTVYASIDGATASTEATVLYAGLAPTLTGLYQLNLTIPSGVTAGDNFLEIDILNSAGNPTSTSEEAIIPIGSGGTPGLEPARPEIENGQTYKANRPRIGKPLKTHVAIKTVQP
jgi:uncharacterized protein (TIGR03437 family)